MFGFLIAVVLCIAIFALESAIHSQVQERSKEAGSIYTMPKILGWAGLIWAVIYALILILATLSCDEEVDEDIIMLMLCVVFSMPFVLGGIFLALYAFNRKFKITDKEITYRNTFRKQRSYPLKDIEKMEQMYGGGYRVYFHGKKVFYINKMFPILIADVQTKAAELGNQIEVVTNVNKQETAVKDGIIVSKINIIGYIAAGLILFLSIFNLITYEDGDGLKFIVYSFFSICGTVMMFYFITYKLTYDCAHRKLTIRILFRTKEYVLDDYERDDSVDSNAPVIVFCKNNAMQFKVDVSILVTNRELLRKELSSLK